MMRDSDSLKDIDRTFTLFKWLLWYLRNHIPLEDREDIETDWKTIMSKINEVEEDVALNDTSRLALINKIKTIFINTHMSYIMTAFPRAGIVTTSDEGKINFDEMDFNTMVNAIRSNSGMPSTLKRSGLKFNEKIEEDKDAIPDDSANL
jgi:hypothetical protein